MYYTKEVPIDQVDSSMYCDFNEREDLIITGNNKFIGYRSDLFNSIVKEIEDDAEAFVYGYGTVQEILAESTYSKGKPEEWETLEAWADLYIDMAHSKRGDEHDYIPRALSLATGAHWTHHVIRGVCQEEWQDLYCVDGVDVEVVEAYYFNTGTEWIIHDEAEPPQTPEGVSGYRIYVIDDPAKEIAEHIGCKEEDLKLWYFDKYRKVPVYREEA